VPSNLLSKKTQISTGQEFPLDPHPNHSAPRLSPYLSKFLILTLPSHLSPSIPAELNQNDQRKSLPILDISPFFDREILPFINRKILPSINEEFLPGMNYGKSNFGYKITMDNPTDRSETRNLQNMEESD
jgi:hypothetical protein